MKWITKITSFKWNSFYAPPLHKKGKTSSYIQVKAAKVMSKIEYSASYSVIVLSVTKE